MLMEKQTEDLSLSRGKVWIETMQSGKWRKMGRLVIELWSGDSHAFLRPCIQVL